MIAEEIVARLRVDSGQFVSGMAAADGALNKFTSSGAVAGGKMRNVGKAMTVGVSAPLLAIGAAASKAAIDFETAFTGVAKTVDGTPEQMDALRSSIINMSREMPASANEIAGVAEAAGQLGIPIDQVSGFTRTMIMMGEATNMTSSEAADSFAHFQNIMGVSSQDMAANSVHVGNAVVELGNKFAATESEIMNTSVRMAGAARVAGMSQPDVMALATAMADVGISSELGGTAMSQTFASMSSAIKGGGQDLDAFARVAGESSQQFQQQFQENAPQAVLAFVSGLQRIKKQGGDVFSTLDKLGITGQRQQQTLLSLAGASKKFASAIQVSNQAFNSGTGLTDEYARRLQTLQSQWDVAVNQMKAAGIDLGTALIPALSAGVSAAQPLLGAIQGIANAFTNADPAVQKFVITAAGVAIALGPIMWMGSRLAQAFNLVRTAISGVVGIFTNFGNATRVAAAGQDAAAAAAARNAQVTTTAGAANARYFGTATAASGAQVRITTSTTGAAGALGRYTTAAGAASAANQRLAGSSAAAATGMTRAGAGARGISVGFGGIALAAVAAIPMVQMLFDAVSDGINGPVTSDMGVLQQQIINFANTGSGAVGRFGDSWYSLGRAFAENASVYDQWVRLGPFNSALNSAEGEIQAVDQTLAQMVQSGHADQAAAAVQRFTEATIANKGSAEDVTGALPQYMAALDAFGNTADTATQDVNQLGSSMSGLDRAAGNAAWQSQFQGMKQAIQGSGAAWSQTKGQILQMAAAQQQAKNSAVQMAGAGTRGANQATNAYRRQIVQLGSLVPKANQGGRAFGLLAKSANMSAGQLKAAVNKYRQGGMSAGKALAAGLRQGGNQAGNAGKQAAARAANQTAQGMRAGGNKIKAASRQAGKGASTGLAQGVRQGAGQAKSAGNRVTQQLQQGFRQGGNKLKTAGQQAGKQGPQGIATGVQQGSGQAIAAETQMIAQLATTMVAAGGTLMSAGQSAGQMMGAGLVAGIQSMLGAAQAAAAELAAVAEEAMRSKAQIQSPSKVWTRLGRHMVAGLVKGLGYKKGVKDAASDLADATATAFNAKAMDLKQGAKKIVDYIVGVRQQIQQFAGVQAFDVSSARSQAAEYAAARDAAIEAAMREAAALKAKNQIQQRVDNAAKAVQQWDQAGNHYQVANALARQKTAMEQLTEATDAYTQAKDASNEADKTFGETKKGGVSAAGILADMTSRQQQATQFSESIKKLKNRGLNQKAIQQLIESGVESGGAIASALLAGANSRNNIAQVNRQTNLMEAASRSLGDYAGQAKFGAQGTYDRQNAIAETKIEVKDGAIRINWGGSAMTATDKAEFQKIAKESLDKALKQLARELRQKKKQK